MKIKENNLKEIIGFIILTMILLKFLRWLVGEGLSDYWNVMFFSELCILIVVSLMNWLYFKVQVETRIGYLRTGLLLSIPALIPAAANYLQMKQLPPWPTALKLLALSLLVGCFEELLFRGMLLRSLLIKWRGLKHGPLLALFVSSVVFGLIHLINLMHQSLPATFYQVEFAFSVGMLLGGIYLRSHNIFLCIFLHALIDSGAFFANWMNNSVTMQTPAIWMLAAGIIVFAPYYLLGVIYVRPSKRKTIFE
ncbi:CPBP family intramembrane glutamic endopeptidase [Liquorilactobacillus uvarum]|uniref:CPBP family intramembrane glutamic endopeptidase n=1 Tax=Liquorilactobacillus uvarum TaxID=303240 RepID=UPI002889F1A2|nr:CPBP family intramembrane glutamic endopeptidase [Liquorilactobacillus uvarum]